MIYLSKVPHIWPFFCEIPIMEVDSIASFCHKAGIDFDPELFITGARDHFPEKLWTNVPIHRIPHFFYPHKKGFKVF